MRRHFSRFVASFLAVSLVLDPGFAAFQPTRGILGTQTSDVFKTEAFTSRARDFAAFLTRSGTVDQWAQASQLRRHVPTTYSPPTRFSQTVMWIANVATMGMLFGIPAEVPGRSGGEEAPADRPTAFDIRRAALYHTGQLKTSPVPMHFRASRESDVPSLQTMSRESKLHYASIGLLSLVRGEGIYASPASGQSSRMNPKEAPDEMKGEIHRLLDDMYRPRKKSEIDSKAAVPLGEVAGKVVTYLGSMFISTQRLEAAARQWSGGTAKSNDVLIMTNDAYIQELKEELAVMGHYGFSPENIQLMFQRLGYQFYANASDVPNTKYEGKKIEGEFLQAALEKAAQIAKAIEDGQPEAGILPGEKTPLGHADFMHEFLRSGNLLRAFKANKRWVSVRNIDNAAAKFDFEWLVTLGMFLDQGLHFQGELSPRFPGMKGGAAIIDEAANARLTESPSFDATWSTVVDEQKAQGYFKVDVGAEAVLKAAFRRDGRIQLHTTRMDYEGGSLTRLEDAHSLLTATDEGKTAPSLELFRSVKGDLRWVRHVRAYDSYWVNNAVAIMAPEFWYYIYGSEGQSLENFVRQLELAQEDPVLMESIVETGKLKYPLLIDPKPARAKHTVAAKPEGNMWQSTLIADTRAKIRMVGVLSPAGMTEERYSSMTEGDQRKFIEDLRFLATKQWKGKAESYQSIQPFLPELLSYLVNEPVLPSDLPSYEQALSAQGTSGKIPGAEAVYLKYFIRWGMKPWVAMMVGVMIEGVRAFAGAQASHSHWAGAMSAAAAAILLPFVLHLFGVFIREKDGPWKVVGIQDVWAKQVGIRTFFGAYANALGIALFSVLGAFLPAHFGMHWSVVLSGAILPHALAQLTVLFPEKTKAVFEAFKLAA